MAIDCDELKSPGGAASKLLRDKGVLALKAAMAECGEVAKALNSRRMVKLGDVLVVKGIGDDMPDGSSFEKHFDDAMGFVGALKLLKSDGEDALNAELKRRGIRKTIVMESKGSAPQKAASPASASTADMDKLRAEIEDLTAQLNDIADLDKLTAERDHLRAELDGLTSPADVGKARRAEQWDPMFPGLKIALPVKKSAPAPTPSTVESIVGQKPASAASGIKMKRVEQWDPMFPGMQIKK